MGRRRVRRLMRKLGLWAVTPKRNTSKRPPGDKVYPYLLRAKTIDRANQVWAVDITLHTNAAGIFVLGRDHRLGDPAGAVLAPVKHAHGGLLRRGTERGSRPVRQARHLQY